MRARERERRELCVLERDPVEWLIAALCCQFDCNSLRSFEGGENARWRGRILRTRGRSLLREGIIVRNNFSRSRQSARYNYRAKVSKEVFRRAGVSVSVCICVNVYTRVCTQRGNG